MNKKLIFVALLLLSSCSWFDPNIVKVKRIVDGDTVIVQRGEDEMSVRLACIDAPEMSQQPAGNQAKERLTRLIPVNSNIRLNPVDVDRYNRVVAEIYQGNTLVNLQLVKEGQALVYRQYLSNCDGERYIKAEEQAKRQKKGFWRDENTEKPWLFRRRK